MRTAMVAIALLLLATEARAVTIQLTCTDGKSRTVVRGRGQRRVLKPPSQYEVCDIDHSRDGICTFAIEADCLSWLLSPVYSDSPCVGNLDHACECVVVDLFQDRFTVSARTDRRPAKLVRRFAVHRNRIRIVMRCRRGRHASPPTVPAGDLSGAWTLAGAVTSDGCPDAGNPVEDTLYIRQAGTTLRARGRSPICYAGDVSYTTPKTFFLRYGTSCAVLDGTLTSPDSVPLRQTGTCPACAVTWEGTMTRRPCASHADCTPIHACSRCVDGACR